MIHELWGVADAAGAGGIVDDDDNPMDGQAPGFYRRDSKGPSSENPALQVDRAFIADDRHEAVR